MNVCEYCYPCLIGKLKYSDLNVLIISMFRYTVKNDNHMDQQFFKVKHEKTKPRKNCHFERYALIRHKQFSIPALVDHMQKKYKK